MHFEYFCTLHMYFRLNIAMTKTQEGWKEERMHHAQLLKKDREKGSEEKKETEEINVH